MRCSSMWMVVVIGCLMVAGMAEAQKKPTIAVLDFTVESTAVKLSANSSSVEIGPGGTTSFLSSDLITALVETRKFDVVERERLNDVTREKQFANLTAGEAMELGKLLKADYLIVGKLELIEVSETNTPIPYTNLEKHFVSGRLIVNMRVVDSTTGKIVSAKKLNKTAKKESGTALAFLDTLKGVAVKDLVNDVLSAVFPIKVVSVTGDEVLINRGSEWTGFSAGQEGRVYIQGDVITDPDTNEELGRQETPIAIIKVVEILEKFTKATVVEKTPDRTIEKGQIVRFNVEPPATASGKETPGSSEKPLKLNW